MTGSSASDVLRARRPQLARDELGDRADDREGVVGRGEARHRAALGGAPAFSRQTTSAKAARIASRRSRRLRPGADDLDEQRLRLVGVTRDRVEERAHPGAQTRSSESWPAARAAPRHRAQDAVAAASKSARMHSSLLAKCS